MNFIYDVSKEPDPSKDGDVLENLSVDELDTMVAYLIAAKSGKPLFSGEQRKRIQEICDRYAAHGVTMGQCEFIVASGLRHGFDFEQALLGLRMGLSHEYHTHEYFTVTDISRITGERPEEIESYVREHEQELFETGQLLYFINIELLIVSFMTGVLIMRFYPSLSTDKNRDFYK